MTEVNLKIVPVEGGIQATAGDCTFGICATEKTLLKFYRDYSNALHLGICSVEVNGRRYELTTEQQNVLQAQLLLERLQLVFKWQSPANNMSPIHPDFFKPDRTMILFVSGQLDKIYPKESDVVIAMTAEFLRLPLYQVRSIYQNHAAYVRLF